MPAVPGSTSILSAALEGVHRPGHVWPGRRKWPNAGTSSRRWRRRSTRSRVAACAASKPRHAPPAQGEGWQSGPKMSTCIQNQHHKKSPRSSKPRARTQIPRPARRAGADGSTLASEVTDTSQASPCSWGGNTVSTPRERKPGHKNAK